MASSVVMEMRPFGNKETKGATTPGELINIDVCGPMQQQSLGGAKFYVCFKDDFTKYLKDKSPYELWFSKVISIDNLGVFGTECFVYVPQQKRRKCDKKSIKGVFVGYSSEKDGYRIWIKDQNKVILSQDVIFQNEKSSCVPNVSSTDIQNSDTEILKKPPQTSDPDVEKEIEKM
ncbi:retrovirus-related Pol polyprotein from transposon TNT 1-94 [Trichonephila inaurata madagascariensis]|uniref:Retrovirus-related Pol polyprotein from transposon TNT 1-94 n=1 Tax=Trichonephila inaurata madagascariensis TaxID=2747483 RepID=A0A8X6WZQ0_9ARAC|nr:retrovirus-related Pol polyprotein from transposon TNT 1-94 [Trichonephila inaurata madagascariensis]